MKNFISRNNLNRNLNFKKKRAFTLVEMMVSLGIFSIVSVVALGSLVRIITANQKAQSLQSAMTNINFALEAMSRDLRVGTSYHCWSDGNSQTLSPDSNNDIAVLGCQVNHDAVLDNSKTSVITFKSSRTMSSGGNTCSLINSYRFKNVGDALKPDIRLQKLEQTSCNPPQTIDPNGYLDMVSVSNVKITDYRLGVNTVNTNYPTVLVRIIGYAGSSERDKTYFDIQTTLSGRVPQL